MYDSMILPSAGLKFYGFLFLSSFDSAIYASMFLPHMNVCTIKLVAYGPRGRVAIASKPAVVVILGNIKFPFNIY
jgi:hypothetical protein